MGNYLYLLNKRQTIWALSQSGQWQVMQVQQVGHQRQIMSIQVNRVASVLERVLQRQVLAGYKAVCSLAEERREGARRDRQLGNKANRTLQSMMRQWHSSSKKTVLSQLRMGSHKHSRVHLVDGQKQTLAEIQTQQLANRYTQLHRASVLH